MIKKLSIYLSVIVLTVSAVYFSMAAENRGYRERFIEFLEKIPVSGESEKAGYGDSVFIDEGETSSSGYRKGDWYEYTSEKNSYSYLKDPDSGNIYSGDDVRIDSYGSANLNMKYGKVRFTNKKYKQSDDDRPESKVIQDGFMPEQVVKLHADGEVGNRIKVYIDHDSTRSRDENHYLMQYKAETDEEVIREVNAGEIDIKFNQSKYAVYDNTEAKGLGADITLAKNNFFIKAFGSIARGETAVEYFSGNSSRGNIKLSEYQFIRKTYYQLEPFIRYDGVTVMPSGPGVYSLIAVTSSPAAPSTYSLNPVNLSSDGFALYLDDQNQYNNLNAIKFSLDGGYYTKLVSGTDYSINYTTGVVTFLMSINENARIFAVYSRNGGTMDPCAIPPGDSGHPGGVFSGKNIVFIRYGYSLNEDTVTKNLSIDSGETDNNGDGRINLDVYEIRSYYYLGSRNLLSDNFTLNFSKENSEMTGAEIASLSPYSVDQTDGLLKFNLREPYRVLFSPTDAASIYSEKYLNATYLYSVYSINSEYSVDTRSFQLKHTNVIENSVRIKVSKKEITKSLYSVDYQAGYVSFVNPANPVIGTSTEVEIKYEYLPFGVSANKFIGGIRSDYEITRDLKIGGSMLVSKDTKSEIIPDVGSESKQTNVFEGDVSLKLTPKRLADIFSALSGSRNRRIPAEFTAYAEYAKSFQDTNTFGKALVDNMESSDDIVTVSMSEKDWILSSMPSGSPQTDRGVLNYYYYRQPDSPETLEGGGFSPYAVDYSVKPGPFNIAMGHVADQVTAQDSQKSLVFDYNFTDGTCFSVVTRKLSTEAVDLSGIQYLEMWVRLDAGAAGNSIDLYADFGSVNEDSDGDGTLDKEDANNNGYIDATPSSGYSEDVGYTFNGNRRTVVGSGPGFNSMTRGDGVLNTEDLNQNGTLDTGESVYTVRLGTLSVTAGEWKKIKIDVDSLTSSQINILKQTSSVRLYGRQNSGTSGRLYIDSFKIVSSKWKSPALDGISVDNADIINISLLNTVSDSDYRNSSFLLQNRALYESFYGSSSTDNIYSQSETALQINYSIPPSNSEVSVTRTFSKKLDLRFYKTMNIWINARNIYPSNTIYFILGSSDHDYFEYRTVPVTTSLWEQVSLKLANDSGGIVDKYKIAGTPDLRRIKYMKIGITGSNTYGSIWFNEIYVSEPEKLEGDAHWYETSLKILAPLAKTATGVPVLSDINLKYINRGNSSHYNSLNKTTSDISENYNEVYSSAKILPNFDLGIDFIKGKSESDSLDENFTTEKRGITENNQLLVNSVFNSTGGSVPTVVFNYSMINNNNIKQLETSGIDYKEKTDDIAHTPIINWKQEIESFIFGKLNMVIGLNMAFREHEVERNAETSTDAMLASYTDLNESDKRQEAKASVQLNYSTGGFYLNPGMDIFSNEIVQWRGGEEDVGVDSDVSGGYHFPLIQNGKAKFLERNNAFTLKTGYKDFEYFQPEYSIGMSYQENGFSDYSDSLIKAEGYERSKSGVSNLSTKIKLPVMLSRIQSLKYLRLFQVSYSRSMLVTEKDIPYEGENTGYFDETYGVSRIYSSLSPAAYNLLSFWPGYFFLGRGNYGHGRDIVYDQLNSNLDVMNENSSIEYNNGLMLQENISTELQISLDSGDITVTAGLNQNCQRTDLYGIPGQVITAELGINSEFDIIKILKRDFARESGEDDLFNSVIISAGIDYSDNMIITANTDEQEYSPLLGVTFKMSRSSFRIKGGLDYRIFKNHEFIDMELEEGDSDYIYLQNMQGNESFKEKDYGYKLNVGYETDVQWIYDYFSLAYKLTGIPVFSIEYIMQINRYNYTATVSPEPYDLYQIKSGLTLNLHKNVKGTFAGSMALENYRNRDSNSINTQTCAYELSWDFALVF